MQHSMHGMRSIPRECMHSKVAAVTYSAACTACIAYNIRVLHIKVAAVTYIAACTACIAYHVRVCTARSRLLQAQHARHA